jgi:hypothetical protein
VAASFILTMTAEFFPKAARAISPHRTKARPHAPAASVLRTSSLKVFLDRRSASAWRREVGKRDDLKGADSAGSVRADAVFFNAEIEDSQSTLGYDEGVSHLGRRSSSTSVLAGS